MPVSRTQLIFFKWKYELEDDARSSADARRIQGILDDMNIVTLVKVAHAKKNCNNLELVWGGIRGSRNHITVTSIKKTFAVSD